jgi:hypothetical protein
MRTVFAVCALLCALTINAEARQSSSALHPQCGIWFPCVAPYASTPEQVRITRGHYIARQMGGFGGPNIRKRHHRSARRYQSVSQRLAALPPLTISKPQRFIAGRLVCARNVNVALAERGITGTGSALALSFLHWGHSAGGPVPGSVIVSRRRGGGHVAIVSRVHHGVVYAWNATGGRRDWREIAYRHRVLDYRLPG